MITTKQLSWREYTIEFLLTYGVVLVYGLALFRAPSSLVHIIVSLFFGVLFLIMRKRILAFGNPVMTLAMFALRKISVKTMLALTSFQLAAGTLAGLTLRGLVDKMPERIAGIIGFAKPSFNAGLGEFLGAFILVAGMLALIQLHRGNDNEPTSIWNMIIVMFASFLTAAIIGSIGMLNPAIAFSIALHFNYVYTIIPIVAGIAGALFYTFVIEGTPWRSVYPRKHVTHSHAVAE